MSKNQVVKTRIYKHKGSQVRLLALPPWALLAVENPAYFRVTVENVNGKSCVVYRPLTFPAKCPVCDVGDKP